jgi:succinate dehydrogenase / fumarate reductase membrane anchor subunit
VDGGVVKASLNKHGLHHWWWQRLTAVVLVPLLIWLVLALAALGDADYATVVQWLSRPYVTVLWILTIPAVFWHGALGMQMVIGDYVGSSWQRTALIVVNGGAVLLSLVSIAALLKIALGAGA